MPSYDHVHWNMVVWLFAYSMWVSTNAGAVSTSKLFLCAIISSQVSISHHRRGTDIYFDFFFLAYDPKGIDLFIEKQKKSLRANALTRIHLRSWKLAICLSLSISLALYQIFFQMSAGIQSTIIITQRLIEALLGCIECLNRKIKV